MFHSSRKFLYPLALLASLAGCQTSQSQNDVPTIDGGAIAIQAADDIGETRLIVAGMSADAALASESALSNALDAYGNISGPPPANLRARIQRIRNNPVNGMTGVGGIFGDAFLDAAFDTLGTGNTNPNKDNFDTKKRVVVFMSGQITGYERNTNGSGYIEATTYITRVVVPNGPGKPPVHTTAYRYRVDVADGGFTIIARNDNVPGRPFPGTTLSFSDEMKARVELLGFNRKLWAQGDSIRVTSLQIARNYNPASPNWQNVPAGHPMLAQSTDSCIDMMFAIPDGGEVPMNFSELQAPPFYCLGRCANPLLINTK